MVMGRPRAEVECAPVCRILPAPSSLEVICANHYTITTLVYSHFLYYISTCRKCPLCFVLPVLFVSCFFFFNLWTFFKSKFFFRKIDELFQFRWSIRAVASRLCAVPPTGGCRRVYSQRRLSWRRIPGLTRFHVWFFFYDQTSRCVHSTYHIHACT